MFLFRFQTWRLALVLLAFSIVALGAFMRSRGRKSFYLERAVLQAPDRILVVDDRGPTLQSHTLPVFGHRIARGDGVILATRWYSDGLPLLMDDESYEKLTIELRELPVADSTLTLGTGAIAVYSDGASAWPRGGCHGFLGGTLRVNHATPASIHASLDATVERAAPPHLSASCTGRRIQREISVSAMTFDELTPFLGLGSPDNHPYSDTYP